MQKVADPVYIFVLFFQLLQIFGSWMWREKKQSRYCGVSTRISVPCIWGSNKQMINITSSFIHNVVWLCIVCAFFCSFDTQWQSPYGNWFSRYKPQKALFRSNLGDLTCICSHWENWKFENDSFFLFFLTWFVFLTFQIFPVFHFLQGEPAAPPLKILESTCFSCFSCSGTPPCKWQSWLAVKIPDCSE